MKYKVRLSPTLLESMTLAAVEAYCYGNRSKQKSTPVETLGYIWGYRKKVGGSTIFYLDRTSVSISAERQYHSVTPNIDAAILKNEVLMRWSPHLTLLGDFHSHPYRNLKEVTSEAGYNFSPEDLKELKLNDFIWEESGDNPVILVITVCRLGRVRDSVQDNFRNNIARYAVGDFQFWLNAAVGYVDGEDKRCVTGNTNSDVHLSVEGWYFNAAGGRVRAANARERPQIAVKQSHRRKTKTKAKTKAK